MSKKQKLIDVILESAQLVATGPDAEKYGLDLSKESIKRLGRQRLLGRKRSLKADDWRSKGLNCPFGRSGECARIFDRLGVGVTGYRVRGMGAVLRGLHPEPTECGHERVAVIHRSNG
jgi:hypothetical protein